MFGVRAKAREICDRKKAKRAPLTDSAPHVMEGPAMIAHAIYLRDSRGDSTTLRQLHRISDLSQPEALRIVAQLEREGLVHVTRDIHDALESRVKLTRRMRERFDEVAHKDAA